MTWYWNFTDDGDQIAIWTHRQDPATDEPHATADYLQHAGETPQAVYDAMSEYIDTALAEDRTGDAVAAGRDAACRQIERHRDE